METQNLRAFLEVTEAKSFSLAAENLHLTQPAISKRISSLETQLNCKLFDRIGRTVQLTEAGLALLPQAQQILQAVKNAQRSISDLQGDVSGTLSLGISHHIGLHRLPPVLESFSKQYPEVHFDIDFLDSEEAYEQVMHGHIELGVITLDPTDTSTLKGEPLWNDELIVTAAPSHPLASMNDLSLSTLSEFTAILPGLNTYTSQIVESLFKKHKLTLDISIATNYLETLKMMASIGLGWSVLPKTMLDDSIKELKVNDFNVKRTLGYVYHNNRSLSNAATAFLDILKKSKDA